jgi:multidrug transporter EmrE-like cation transporter
LALVLNAAANLLMKIGMKNVQASGGLLKDGPAAGVAVILSSGTLLTGLCCFAMNAAFYMYALQSPALKISVAYPVMVGGGYALIAAIAHWHPALRESLTAVQKLGVGLVLMGILFVASGTRDSVGP